MFPSQYSLEHNKMVQNYKGFLFKIFSKTLFLNGNSWKLFQTVVKATVLVLYHRQSFTRLRANGLFHGLFGLDEVMIVVWFCSKNDKKLVVFEKKNKASLKALYCCQLLR